MAYSDTRYAPYDFANRRHIGPSPEEMAEMLQVLGADSLESLINAIVPDDIRVKEPLAWGEALSEQGVLTHLRAIADKNRVMTSFIGQGYHGTVTPPAIQRNIFENPAWYTAYTPYQPEISQGRLEALLNYQTMITDLTALDMANASLLDEGTAAAEAMALCHRAAKSKATAFFVDHHCHPQTIAVIHTRAAPLGWEVIVGDPFVDLDCRAVVGALFQYPGTYGHVHDFTDVISALHAEGALGCVAADPMALVVLKAPGEMGADIAVGTTQRFGVPMGYGGPHAAFMAVRESLKRNVPGRIVGVSIDARGNRAYRLALQTREQHIRREKATSNVCTAQALLAVMASMYAVFHGPHGLKAIAERIHRKTVRLARGLEAQGYRVEPATFFDTITVEVGAVQGAILTSAEDAGINLRRVGETRIGISLDERARREHTESIWRAFGIDRRDDDRTHDYRLPESLVRQSTFMTHPVFHMNRAEAELTRYMRRLADRDLALDRAMIPLGSCTMKLNATAEMMALSWREFSDVHPYAPARQTRGYAEMITDLEVKLCQITGYDAVSMQPNAGAQGEYAGLLAIQGYHRARGEGQRDICLIPTSAHGTNPASAQMAGMKVVVVKVAANGDIDVEDFRARAEHHSERLAACMITYPSTHGVFETTVREVCEITHQHGGQVYLDGANMNAMVGLSRPGDFGSDVSHLNLHKTFAIPHGGGGPGMGPIGVVEKLTPFLPGHPVVPTGGDDAIGPVAAAPYGSALISLISWAYIAMMGPIGVKAHLAPHLPGDPESQGGGAVSSARYGSASVLLVSWAYCLLMGGEGLTQATRVAILNANYIASRLATAYPILYSAADGRVAHECILDTRGFKTRAGVTVDDIAKRLIDCGFHAPTMAWPVAGTMMVEPTESEPKAELDRFVAAMLGIASEAEAIASGQLDAEDNPLKHAPHTVEDLVGEWDRRYDREAACFPAGAFRVDKYWSPVNRVDNVYGDRHLVCSCPPMDSYTEAEE